MPSPIIRQKRSSVEVLGDASCPVSAETTSQPTWSLRTKRLIDIFAALAGIAVCGVIYLWYGSRIRRETGGSALFRQLRVGHNGRRFCIYKFRTMYANAEDLLKELAAHNEMSGHLFKMQNDPRITPLGRKLRRRYLDELPQFFNVLRGEMSLVGARPPTVEEVAHYSLHHRRRLSMKPGITGLWQIVGNGGVKDFEDVVRLDCEYIDNWSLLLDLKIIAKTLLTLTRAKGW